MLFASDTGSAVGKQYAAFDPKSNLNDRSLYVVAPDGTIAYPVRPLTLALTPALTREDVPDATQPASGSRSR